MACHKERLNKKYKVQEILIGIEKEKERYGKNLTGIFYSLQYARCAKDGLNRYTAYNRYPGFNVKDYHTEIPLRKEDGETYRREFADMPRYITVSYGWDMIKGRGINQPQAKVWPFEYWTELVKLLKKELPGIGIVQTGARVFPQIPGCDRYIMGRSMTYVEWLLKGSLLHIDIEGGLVHLATQLGTKCVVLFGPTPMHFYAYEDNINLSEGGCHNCCWLLNNYDCYRRMEKPECMWSIKPETVLAAVTNYLRSNN